LENIKKVGVVTTYGSSYGVIRYVGDPGRRIIARGLRPLFSKECTVLWLGMYSCDNATQKEREEFLEEVEAYMREFRGTREGWRGGRGGREGGWG